MEIKRIEWIDAVRGVAFLMVIYKHLIYENTELMYYFFPVFLTMFFFVSGYLFKNTLSFKQLVEQRLRTLLLPFLIFGLLLIFSEEIFPIKNQAPLVQRLTGFFLQIRNHYDKLWFIAALLVMNFPFYFLIKYVKSTKILLAISFVLFLLSTTYRYYLQLPALPWHIQYIGFGCFYMTLGYVYKQYESRLTLLGTKGIPFALLFLYILLLFIRQTVFHNSPIVTFVSSYYVFDALLITCLGIAAIIYLLKLANRQSKLLVFVGANSLLYFALHGKMLLILQALIETVF
ncbi:MAG: acyltransferase family protein, partial [Bacteroidales bacterium]|nr:acyltransferase family protein [Bacteroidales bacterium]